MRNSSVAVQTQQPKNTSAVSGRMPSRTKADGSSAIANSKVASNSVPIEIIAAASNAVRTDGLATAIVIAGVASVIKARSCCRFAP
jgi:hypothetical protein